VTALAVTVFGAVALGIVQASFVEWAFHRYWLHRPWLPKGCFTSHTLVHHQLCKFGDTFEIVEEEQHESLTFKWWGGPLLILIILSPWLCLAWWSAAIGWALPRLPFLIALGVTTSLYYAGYEGLHHLMHMPRFPWVERARWFQFLKKHHRIHHIKMNRNLNVLVPIADFFLGTLVTTMPGEVPTPASARALARRHSNRRKQDEIGEELAS